MTKTPVLDELNRLKDYYSKEDPEDEFYSGVVRGLHLAIDVVENEDFYQ